MILYAIPYDTEKNIGKFYNKIMELLPNDDDYACFVDGDTIFTTSNYGNIIQNIVSANPEVGCFTCMTNRVNCPWQLAPGVNKETNDILYHRDFGKKLHEIYKETTTPIVQGKHSLMSGMLMLVKKSAWKKAGNFLNAGFLGVDNDFHRKLINAKQPIHTMNGVYVYHWYRNKFKH